MQILRLRLLLLRWGFLRHRRQEQFLRLRRREEFRRHRRPVVGPLLRLLRQPR